MAMTRQQMNDYMLARCEQEIKDEPTVRDRLFNSYRAWVLAVINAGKDQLMSKPTSTQGGNNDQNGGQQQAGSEGEQAGPAPAQPQA